MLSISIVTPAYNHAQHLPEAIESVLSQSYCPLEYWVIDGGSADQTRSILQSYAGRLRWISEPDRGQTDAIMKGFQRTEGEIIAWLNADDRYRPGTLEAVSQFFVKHPQVALVYGDAHFIDSAGRDLGRSAQVETFNYRRLLTVSDFIIQPAAFFRRSAYEAVCGLDASLSWSMDYDLWLKIAGRFEVAYLPMVLADYRWDGGNKTATGGMDRLHEVERVVRKHGGDGLPAYFAIEAAAMQAGQSFHSLLQGHYSQAFTSAREAAGYIFSQRVWGALGSRSAWRIIETRRKIRRRAGGLH